MRGFFAVALLAHFHATLGQTTCNVNNVLGVCIDTAQCSGTSTPGFCPGAANIQCCTDPVCNVPGVGSGTCRQTGACGGQNYPGYCAGPTDLQCCVQGGTSPTPAPGSCRYVTRAEWGARAPRSSSYMGNSVPYVFIHHTAGAECNTTASCMSQMRGIQNFHMDSRGWSDIGYSFLIGGDGNLYEGRGFNVQGAHTSGYNSVGYGISFIGDFTSKLPTSGAQNAYFRAVNDCLLPQRKISTSYQMYGHRQPGTTACPGDTLYPTIQQWPNWTSGSPRLAANVSDLADEDGPCRDCL